MPPRVMRELTGVVATLHEILKSHGHQAVPVPRKREIAYPLLNRVKKEDPVNH